MGADGKREEIRLGRNYCLAVDDPSEALGFLRRMLARSASPCVLVTTIHPRKVTEDHSLESTEVMWVSDEPSKELRSVQPSRMKFEMTKDLLAFIAGKEAGIVFIEGIEYLIQVNGFDGVLAFVKQVGDKAGARGHSLLVSVNARSLPEQQYVLFRGRFDRAGNVRDFRTPGEVEMQDDILGGAFQFPVRKPGGQEERGVPTSAPRPAATVPSSPQQAGSSSPAAREPTGVNGLDQLIEGGFPGGAAVLLQSPAGQERELFAAQFAIEGLRSGQQVAMTLSNMPVDEVRDRLRSLGCDSAEHEAAGRLRLIDWYSHRDQRILGIEERAGVTVVSKGLTNLEIAISKIMRGFQGKPGRFVVDFLTPAIYAQGFESSKKLAETLRVKFGRQGITSLFLLDKGTHDPTQASALRQAFDGVIDVEQEKVGNLVERKAAVLTMRRTFVRTEYFPLDMVRGQGVSLRVIVVEPRGHATTDEWSSAPAVAPTVRAGRASPASAAQDSPMPTAKAEVSRDEGPIQVAGPLSLASVVPAAEAAAADPAPFLTTNEVKSVEDVSSPDDSNAVIVSETPLAMTDQNAATSDGSAPATAVQTNTDGGPAIEPEAIVERVPAALPSSPAAELASPAEAARAEPATQTTLSEPAATESTPAQDRMPSSSAPCPTCSTPMRYVPQYRAWWCDRCQSYGALADPQHMAAQCPRCGSGMTYNAERSSWYCYLCAVYPYEPQAPQSSAQAEVPVAAHVPSATGSRPGSGVSASTASVEPVHVPTQVTTEQGVVGAATDVSQAQPDTAEAVTPVGEDAATVVEPGTSSPPTPADQSPVAAQPAAVEPPKCPTCSRPLGYLAEYLAWYCYTCQSYGAIAYQ